MIKTKMLLVILISILLTNFFVVSSTGEEINPDEVKHVLVINAYHKGFEWTDNMTEAIQATLNAYDETILVSVEYIDWKRYPDQANLDYQYDLLKYKYKDEHISLIIGTDDIGMQFAIDHRAEIFNNAPIVFTAVFEEAAQNMMAGESNITGIYETIDCTGTIKAIMTIHPDLEHVYIVRDNSESAKGLEDSIENAFLSLGSVAEGIERIPLHDYPFYEIKKIVADPKPNSVIIMGSYNTDSIGFKLADQVFSSELSETSAIPIYSVYEYLFNYGIVGGSLLSGSLQGEEGAKLAIKILSGIPISELPVVTDKTAYYGFDYLYLEKFEIPIELLPVGTEVIINKPFSTFEQYRVIILTTFSVFIMLVVFIIILSVNIKIKKRAKLEIENSHLELIDAYGSLTNSELKLKSRNDSLQEQQERINFLAYNDYLTGLPNRLEIKRYAEKMMRIVDQDDGHMLLVFIDLDNFKYINTSYGHKAGDVLLEQLAGRFNRLISDRSQIGRLGGDEFVFLARVEDEASIVKYVMPIMQLFKNSFNIVGQSVHVSASMGYSVYPNDAGFYDDLLIRADMAMFKMKEYGKAKAGRFDMKMNHEMNHKISIINELHEAIERDEFYLLYQPQYDMVNDKIVGFEALIRWNSTKLGLICPDDFISIAESNGSIVQIGEWVIREAATFAKFININEDADIIIAINISVIQLLQRNFTDRVRVILNEVGVLPEYIEFEITESVFIESFDVAGEQLDELRNMGIQIALDDFGTGYSSLTYLKYLPITTLKIDRNFIVDIIREGKEHFFTQAIIDIGHKLGFRIIAEGVEEEIQKNYLIEHGCSIMQGYLFSKPVYFEEAIALYYECLKDDLLDA